MCNLCKKVRYFLCYSNLKMKELQICKFVFKIEAKMKSFVDIFMDSLKVDEVCFKMMCNQLRKVH